jgi:hypothetical protein
MTIIVLNKRAFHKKISFIFNYFLIRFGIELTTLKIKKLNT